MPPLVLGRKKKRLSRVGYRVVSALLRAGDRGLRREDLTSIAHDAPGIVRRLRASDPDWMEILEVPTDVGLVYRIVDPRACERDTPGVAEGESGRH